MHGARRRRCRKLATVAQMVVWKIGDSYALFDFQGYEDWQRHKADYEINNSEAYVIRGGISMKVRSMDLRVGDIIKVTDDASIPCDMLLLSSANADGRCHITSVNLDGETNLKVRPSTVKQQ